MFPSLLHLANVLLLLSADSSVSNSRKDIVFSLTFKFESSKQFILHTKFNVLIFFISLKNKKNYT